MNIAYTRVSTERQTDGNGLAQQRTAICAWAAATGMRIDDWASDAETGMSADREEVQRLLTMAQAGKVARLIIDRMDRLGRKLIVIEALYEQFTKAGTEVICVAQALDNSPTGGLVRQILGAVAEHQRAEMLVRMRTCKRVAVAKKGTYGGGGNPYGYKSIGNGQLAIDDNTVDLVRRAFTLKGEGMTLVRIASTLDHEGFRTRKGTRLHPQQISRILARKDAYTAVAPIQHITLEKGVLPQQPQIVE